MDKIFFQRESYSFVYPKKIDKMTHSDGGSLSHYCHSNIFDFGFHFISISSALFFIGHAKVEVQIKANPGVAPFFISQG